MSAAKFFWMLLTMFCAYGLFYWFIGLPNPMDWTVGQEIWFIIVEVFIFIAFVFGIDGSDDSWDSGWDAFD